MHNEAIHVDAFLFAVFCDVAGFLEGELQTKADCWSKSL